MRLPIFMTRESLRIEVANLDIHSLLFSSVGPVGHSVIATPNTNSGAHALLTEHMLGITMF